MTLMLTRRVNGLLGGLIVLFLAGATPTAAARTLAVFGDAAAAQEAPTGWRFQWNPVAEVGDFSQHADLTPFLAEGRRGVALQARGVLDEAGKLRADRPSVTSGGSAIAARDEQGAARWAMASFTLPADATGDVWLQHGNLQNRSFPEGTDLKVYLNGNPVGEWKAGRDRVPLLFQQALGPLKKGDTVTVAVGPGTKGKSGGGRLRYILEDLPSGQTPPPPQNIIWQPIDAAHPQFAADGSSSAYEAKHNEQNAAVIARKPELVFIGDSITARWPQELLEKHYGEFRPVNLGVGGDWVQNVRWRIQNSPLEQAPVKVVVLLVGTNNLSGQFTPEEIAAGLDQLVRQLRDKLPRAKILLLGVLPRGASMKEPTNETIRVLNTKLRSLEDKNVVFLDVGPALVEPDGTIAPEVMPDRLHVALPGYLRWMEVMEPVLNRMLGNP